MNLKYNMYLNDLHDNNIDEHINFWKSVYNNQNDSSCIYIIIYKFIDDNKVVNKDIELNSEILKNLNDELETNEEKIINININENIEGNSSKLKIHKVNKESFLSRIKLESILIVDNKSELTKNKNDELEFFNKKLYENEDSKKYFPKIDNLESKLFIDNIINTKILGENEEEEKYAKLYIDEIVNKKLVIFNININ